MQIPGKLRGFKEPSGLLERTRLAEGVLRGRPEALIIHALEDIDNRFSRAAFGRLPTQPRAYEV